VIAPIWDKDVNNPSPTTLVIWSPIPIMPDITLSPAAIKRLVALAGEDPSNAGLRLAVLGGGCSGFQYDMALAGAPQGDDIVVEAGGAKLFVDPMSIPFLAGSVVDWADELIGASFKIKNPNAVSSCGCGVSFAV
jgi:iron-sulfur cluster assembly accessory protein